MENSQRILPGGGGGETESEIIATPGFMNQIQCNKKYYKQKPIATANSVSNLMRQWTTSYQHTQYWQKNT